jgi:hypothetical protein
MAASESHRGGVPQGSGLVNNCPVGARLRHSPRASGRFLSSSSGSGRPNGPKETCWSCRGINAPFSQQSVFGACSSVPVEECCQGADRPNTSQRDRLRIGLTAPRWGPGRSGAAVARLGMHQAAPARPLCEVAPARRRGSRIRPTERLHRTLRRSGPIRSAGAEGLAASDVDRPCDEKGHPSGHSTTRSTTDGSLRYGKRPVRVQCHELPGHRFGRHAPKESLGPIQLGGVFAEA